MSEKLKPCSLCGGNRRAERWIPVSERLPEEEGPYLVTVVREEWRTFVDKCFLGRKLTVEGEFMWLCDEQCKITAWRPLPEPYEEEK